MAIFLQDNTYDDNVKLIFGQTTGATNFPFIKWRVDNPGTSRYLEIDNSNNYCIQQHAELLWLTSAAGTTYSGIQMQLRLGKVELWNTEGTGNAGTIRLSTTTSGVDINGKFVTSAVSDCAGLNMTDDLDMNANDFIDSQNSTGSANQVLISKGTGNGTEWITLPGSSGAGTVTSVAALTLGTTGTDLSSSVVNSTTAAVITLNVPTASAANRGALSSSDWATFNGKMSSFTIQGDSGSSQVTGLQTVDIAGGTGITTAESSRTVTVTNSLPFNGISVAGTSGGSSTISNNGTITIAAGSGITTTNSGGTVTIAATGGGGSMSSWTLTADSGGSETISNAETVTIAGGTNITTARSGATVTITNGITNNNQLTNGANYTTNNGTVTAVNGTAPVVSSGGTAPTISMAAATTSVDGYLTAGNFTTFNNKMTNFTIEADTGGAATIDNGDAIDIIGGTSITTHRSGNNITINSSAAGTVVSVGLAVPSAFTVTGSPITTTGTLTIAGAGTTSQYIRGNGTLATFPTIPAAGVTSVATGSGLTGGTITSTGTVSVDYTATGIIADCPGGTGSPDENDLIMIGLDSSSSGETRAYEIQEITSLAPQGTVTSVGITAGTGISVSNSPITSSGNITVTNTITNNNQLTNGANYTTNTGTVTTVSAANPTSGGAAGFPLFITSTASTTPIVNLNQGQITGTKVSTATGGGVTSGTWNANTQLDKTSNTDNSYQGEIVYFGTAASSPLAQGKLYIYTATDGQWAAAKADAVGTSAGLLAIALGTTVSAGMFTRGMYTNSYTTTGSSNGSILYIDSVNAGSMTHEPPSGTGKFVRIIATQIDTSNGQIFFHPDNTFIELS
jgi:hypothetical protein